MDAPVAQAASTNKRHFAVGFAMADAPLGLWVDAHPQGWVVSQSYPIANDIQNIAPTVMVDDDQRADLYRGTFGRLQGVKLAPDVVTMIGTPADVRTLTGFFDAPWLFKRNGTYQLAFAGNNAEPNSECTESDRSLDRGRSR